ncbi:hypothetical protein [Terracidiphilus gabretensis]|uniref:hypothetical protein n=1 Tax=Terracidiphilus gabretensis TaxID=1577687 RepID=UPI00071BC422|nr:hypothetical protein [Terracidiphilus gabretensis]
MTPSGQTLSIDPASAETEGIARFPRLAIVSGIVNALLAAWLLMMWHNSFQLPPAALFLPALAYVACSTLLAAAGARYYWRQAKFRSSFTQQELMLTWATAWVWMPAIVLFLRRDFIWAPLLAALAAALPACSMQWLRTKAERVHPSDTIGQPVPQPIFAATLQPIPWDWHGLIIAICVYATCASFFDGDTPLACIIAAAGAFLFAQRHAVAWNGRAEVLSSSRRSQTRLIWSALLAILVTALALIPGQQSSGGFGILPVAAKSTKTTKKPDITEPGGLGSYHSVILWPQKPEKQLIVPPDLLNAAPLTQPQTIHFSGEYWYFEAPAEEPGPNAHTAHGNPMDVSIHTLNTRPLMMQAHQKLAKPIPLSTVRAIDITMLNRDNDPGILSIGVFLTDSAASDYKGGLDLGLQPLTSTQPDHFAVKTVPVSEKLHFVIPAQSRQHRFDGITVMILPAANRMHSGARVAIDHFDLVPR